MGIITRNCEDAVRKVFPNIDELLRHLHLERFDRKSQTPSRSSYLCDESIECFWKRGGNVGDHTIDIQAGKRVGMKTIGVLTGRTKREEFEKAGADYILNEATEIYRLLET